MQPFKLSIQNTLPKKNGSLSSYFKLKHKQDMGPFVASSKFNASVRNKFQLDKWDFSSSWSKRVSSVSLGMNTKATSKKQLTCKLNQAYNFWDGWKWKSSLEVDQKEKGRNYAYNINLIKKRFVAFPVWFRFISQYNEQFGLGFSAKVNGRQKLQSSFKGHVSTAENHKFYLEHKCSGQLGAGSQAPLVNSVTASYQDSLGIGTLNGFLYYLFLLQIF